MTLLKHWQPRHSWAAFTALAILVMMVVAPSEATAQIRIGQTAGFTGPMAADVKDATQGALMYIEKVNREGGVGGQMVELISLDDHFDPHLASDNGRKLIESHRVMAMLLTRGTTHADALTPWLDRYHVPLVGPSARSIVLQQPVQHPARNGGIVAHLFATDHSTESPFAAEALALARKNGVADVSPAMFEGFAAAKVLVDGLRRALPRPDRARLLRALGMSDGTAAAQTLVAYRSSFSD